MARYVFQMKLCLDKAPQDGKVFEQLPTQAFHPPLCPLQRQRMAMGE